MQLKMAKVWLKHSMKFKTAGRTFVLVIGKMFIERTPKCRILRGSYFNIETIRLLHGDCSLSKTAVLHQSADLYYTAGKLLSQYLLIIPSGLLWDSLLSISNVELHYKRYQRAKLRQARKLKTRQCRICHLNR